MKPWAGVPLFSTMSLRPVMQKFELVQSSPETACTEKTNRIHGHEQAYWAMCNRVQHFKSIQSPIKWSRLSSSQYSLLSDHARRHLHIYACSLTRLSVLNQNNINTIRGIDTVSRGEKLPAASRVVALKNYKMNAIHVLSAGGSQPAVCFFQRLLLFRSKFKFTLEKRYTWSLLASRPVILKWRNNSQLTDADEKLLPKPFTMNLFCSAVNITIFLSLVFGLSFSHTTNFVIWLQESSIKVANWLNISPWIPIEQQNCLDALYSQGRFHEKVSP